MTDPDLVFDMDPQNVRRVEDWISQRWPASVLAKQADGSRLTWSLLGPGAVQSIAATESFLSLPAAEVDRHLEDARRICEADQGAPRHLLLATDGALAIDDG
ncbi:MAG TPA: hypothetical protein VK936_14165 [Longimicrobiales bacterium]|nr:hypothetical protein [Longimicrobiales bacterium]